MTTNEGGDKQNNRRLVQAVHAQRQRIETEYYAKTDPDKTNKLRQIWSVWVGGSMQPAWSIYLRRLKDADMPELADNKFTGDM